MPFNPKEGVGAKNLWELLGSFYTNLPPDDKTNMEALWEGLIGGGDALFFNMAQSYLTQYLDQGKGYLDLGYDNYQFRFDGPDSNVGAVQYYSPPVSVSGYPAVATISGSTYQYLVTANTAVGETVPSLPIIVISGASTPANTVAWTSISGASSYNVYGRTPGSEVLLSGNTLSTSFTDNNVTLRTKGPPTENTAIKSYSFDLPGDVPIMTLPTLSGLLTDQVITEGTHYHISDLSNIVFTAPLNAIIGQQSDIFLDNTMLPTSEGTTLGDDSGHSHTYTINAGGTGTTNSTSNGKNHTHAIVNYEVERERAATTLPYHVHRVYNKTLTAQSRSAIGLIPSLTSIYWPAFGESKNPKMIVNSGLYTPYVSGYYGASASYFEKRRLYAQHLTQWTNATASKLRSSPTISNLTDTLLLFNAAPFTYKAGIVSGITASGAYNLVDITTSGTTDNICYQVPNTLYLKYSAGSAVNQYDILCSGAWISDYLTDATVVSGLMDREGSIKTFDMFPRRIRGSSPYYHIVPTLDEDLQGAVPSGSYLGPQDYSTGVETASMSSSSRSFAQPEDNSSGTSY